MRPNKRAGKRSSPQKLKRRTARDPVEMADSQILRLVRALRAIKSARLRRRIVSFAESITIPVRPYRRRKN